MKALKWIWQLPQNLIALIVLALNKGGERRCMGGIDYYLVKKGIFNCGVSLGNYILVPTSDEITIKHEHGHQIQSLYLGPFYLILIGIPSILRNVWDRIFHKNWDSNRRTKWYYSYYPENWADKLGKVKRSFS